MYHFWINHFFETGPCYLVVAVLPSFVSIGRLLIFLIYTEIFSSFTQNLLLQEENSSQ